MAETLEDVTPVSGTARQGAVAQLRELPWAFWAANTMEMPERLAYYGVRLVIPIYIAQADEVHGLHFSQLEKGQIFTLWALVQSGVPDRLAVDLAQGWKDFYWGPLKAYLGRPTE